MRWTSVQRAVSVDALSNQIMGARICRLAFIRDEVADLARKKYGKDAGYSVVVGSVHVVLTARDKREGFDAHQSHAYCDIGVGQ